MREPYHLGAGKPFEAVPFPLLECGALELAAMGMVLLGAMAVLGTLALGPEMEKIGLAPRGYELLPNHRWMEELERDGYLTLLVSFSSRQRSPSIEPNLTAKPAKIQIDFDFDYDPLELHALLESGKLLEAGSVGLRPVPTFDYFTGDEKERKFWKYAFPGIFAELSRQR